MKETSASCVEALLSRAESGNSAATTALLNAYRGRLKLMIRCRMDQRLLARFDPSNVVQETLIAAAAKLPEYLRERPVSFYPWLPRLLAAISSPRGAAESPSHHATGARSPLASAKIPRYGLFRQSG